MPRRERALAFEPALEAHEPPERRGLARDDVRLLVAAPATAGSSTPASATCPTSSTPATCSSSTRRRRSPAALPAPGAPTAPRRAAPLHARCPARPTIAGSSSCAADGARYATGREPATSSRCPAARRAHARGAVPRARRLWVAALELPEPLLAYLAAHGAPIRYAHVPRRAAARRPTRRSSPIEPGSAEMPSAGRPFTAAAARPRSWRAGSTSRRSCSTPASPRPSAASARTPSATASPRAPPARVNATRACGGRVIAVGTTVVRALETVAGRDGDGRGAARAGPTSSSPPSAACAPSTGCSPAGTSPTPATCDARGDRRPRAARALLRRRAAGAATAGTSSATCTCSCRSA